MLIQLHNWKNLYKSLRLYSRIILWKTKPKNPQMYCLQAWFTFTESLLFPLSNFWRHVSPYSWFLASNLSWKLRAAFLLQCIAGLLGTAEISGHLTNWAQSCFLCCLPAAPPGEVRAWQVLLQGKPGTPRHSSMPHLLPGPGMWKLSLAQGQQLPPQPSQKGRNPAPQLSPSITDRHRFLTFFECSCLTRV